MRHCQKVLKKKYWPKYDHCPAVQWQHQCYHCYFQATVFFGFLHSGTQLLFQVIWLKFLSKKRECQCFRWPFFSSTGVSSVTWSSSLAQWRVPSVRSACLTNQTNQLIEDFPSDSIVMVSCIFSSLVVAKSARECHFLCQVKSPIHISQMSLRADVKKSFNGQADPPPHPFENPSFKKELW